MDEKMMALGRLLEKMAKDRGEKKGEGNILRDEAGKPTGRRFTPMSYTKMQLTMLQLYMAIWHEIWPTVKDKNMEEQEAALWANFDKYAHLVKDDFDYHMEEIPEKE